MTASIEDRIVAMKFENKDFEKGVAQSLSSLQKLESTLNKGFSGKGLSDVQNSVGRFNLNPIESALSGISKSWLAMSTIAVTALATVTNSVITTGASMVKSLTLGPLTQGFNEYSTNLQSIQTVLANTEAQGTNLDDVNKALGQLNDYSDKTIYNFGEMAKNIGTFTAAGVSLEGSVESIKGIANLAALSGSSSEQASTAMYQLSQAIASGRVSLQDWNSVVNAGMGGSTFQKALAQTAQAMGTIESSAIKIDEETGKMTINGASFRDSISAIGGEKWLTSDVLTNTLAQFTGDLTKAELAAQGFNDAQIKSIMQTAKTAQDAATKVKTITQVFDIAKETLGSGWARTFQTIFGDFEQARSTFTRMSETINGFINTNSKARNKVLKDWADLNGRTVLIRSIRHAWEALMSVLGPIHDAFREIFPSKTGKDLVDLTRAVNRFFKAITLSADAQENLKDTFAGFFAVLHIGYTIIKGVASVIFRLLGIFIKGQGSTLAFTGSIGEMLVALDKFLTKGKFVENFFNLLGDALAGILEPLIKVRDGLIGAFTGLVTGDPSAFFTGISDAIESVLGLVDSLSDKIAGAVNRISDAFGGLGHISGFNLAGLFAGADTGGTADGINAVKDALGGLEGPSISIRGIWEKIVSIWEGAGEAIQPVIDGVKGVFDELGNAFQGAGEFFRPLLTEVGDILDALREAFSNVGSGLDFTDVVETIKAGLFFAILLEIRNFASALKGVAKSASGVLNQVTDNLKTMQADVRSDVIIKIAVALALLAGAVFLLSKTDPVSLGIALAAVAAMLIALVVAMKVLEKSVGSLKAAGKLPLVAAGLLILSVALAAMAGAVFLFSKMDHAELMRGLEGVALALTALTVAAAIMSKSGAGANMIGAAAGLFVMSFALVAMIKAIKAYSKLDTKELMKGLAKIAGTLIVLGVAMAAMSGSLAGAAALLIVSFALGSLVDALKGFASMSTDEIQQSLVALGASLLILAAGMALMTEGLPGAAALLVMTFALAALIPVIVALSQLDWGTVAKGIGIFILAAAGLAVGSLLLIPVVPVLLGLAGAVTLLGIGILAAGNGVYAFAKALEILAKTGEKGGEVLIEVMDDFMDKIDDWLEKANDAFPEFVKLLANLITAGLQVLKEAAPEFFDTGFSLLISFLEAFAKNAREIVNAAFKLWKNLSQAFADKAEKFADIGLKALIKVMEGFTNAIEANKTQLEAAGERMAYIISQAFASNFRSMATAAFQGVLDGLRGKDKTNQGAVKGTPQKVERRAPKRSPEEIKAIQSLVGGSEEIKETFDNIGEELKEDIDRAKNRIEGAKDQLEKLRRQGKGGSKEAKELEKEIKQQTKLRDELQKEQKKWNKRLNEEKGQLKSLSKQYDTLMANIEEARAALEKAQNERNQFVDQTQSQFDQKPDISAGMSLNSYMRQIAKKTAETKKFMETLQALRAAGLSDASYEQLLAEGTEAQHLMEQLLNGGGTAVEAFNAANEALTGAAGTLASTASTSLYYDAAVASAQATLDGWESQVPALEAQMTKIAKIMIKAIKKALGIKSPSREFRMVADYTTEGFLDGLEKSVTAVETAAENIGNTALDTLQATMNKALDSGVVDFTPTITPVLDLAQLQAEASKIGTMLATDPMVAGVSYAHAASLSAAEQAALSALEASTPGTGDTFIDYTQNLNSPKMISPIDTYRATKSSIPILKEALDV